MDQNESIAQFELLLETAYGQSNSFSILETHLEELFRLEEKYGIDSPFLKYSEWKLADEILKAFTTICKNDKLDEASGRLDEAVRVLLKIIHAKRKNEILTALKEAGSFISNLN